MEFVLLIWDELDDWTHAVRHVAGSAVVEVASLAAPLAAPLTTASSAVSLWVLMAFTGR
jgi:hypothetical protein